MIVFPNAKINIGLFVTGKRPDGFHNLETVFYPVGLSDMLEVLPAEGEPGQCHFVNTGIQVECSAEKNLIVRAYHMLAAEFHLPAIEVHLHKQIPFGAGLGGGSSDAAFMLKALNECFGLQLSENSLMERASVLGSDCAFFIRNQAAYASGKGEQLEDSPLRLEGFKIVIIKPDFSISTPEAYTGVFSRPAGFDLRKIAGLPVTEWKEKIINDFEESLFLKYPRLAELKRYLYDTGACYASMTGSGSALYGLYKEKGDILLDCPGCFVWQG